VGFLAFFLGAIPKNEKITFNIPTYTLYFSWTKKLLYEI
tara:strand:- start:2784 stop:2900 length:117 start_codon:yes stop_codon:yes gene_type:complete